MATRKVKDAKDLSTDELIYFKGHAKATYMSDGTTVEDAIPTKVSQLTNDSGYITSVAKGPATTQATAQTLMCDVNINGKTVTPVKFNGTVGSSTMPVYMAGGKPTPITSFGEANLSWGGENIANGYGPIDASLVNVLGANRFDGLPAECVTVEYSRDGGATWLDYGATDKQKVDMVSQTPDNASLYIGKNDTDNPVNANHKLRVIINSLKKNGAQAIYADLRKFIIYVSNADNYQTTCTIKKRAQSDYAAGNDVWTVVSDNVNVTGWSGYNVINTPKIITYGNSAQDQQSREIMFEFSIGNPPTSGRGFSIVKIFAYGGVGYVNPSNMAARGHLYSYDYQQNANFPSKVNAVGGLQENGTNLSSKYLGINASAKSISDGTNSYTPSAIKTMEANIEDVISDVVSIDTSLFPTSTDEVIGFRQTNGGDGVGYSEAWLDRLKGNTVVWNQYVGHKASPVELRGVTFAYDEQDNCFVINGTATKDFTYYGLSYGSGVIPSGRKAYGMIKVIAGDVLPEVRIGSPFKLDNNYIEKMSLVSDTSHYPQIKAKEGVTYNNVRIQIVSIDLTQMFGAGNEPTNIEEFHARKPLGIDEYAYNEGELISTNVDEIKSVGFNAYNGEYAKVLGGYQYELVGTYSSIGFSEEIGGELTNIEMPSDKLYTPDKNGYIYAQGADICIHLIHTGTRNGQYEPYKEYRLPLPLKDIKDKDGNQLFPNGLLSAGTAYDEITATKAIKRIGVRAYQDGDIVTDGTTTYYELAEPIEVDIDEWDRSYDVSDFGTEEVISDTPTTPLKADIIYEYNAKGRIEANERGIEELNDKIAEMNEYSITSDKVWSEDTPVDCTIGEVDNDAFLPDGVASVGGKSRISRMYVKFSTTDNSYSGEMVSEYSDNCLIIGVKGYYELTGPNGTMLKRGYLGDSSVKVEQTGNIGYSFNFTALDMEEGMNVRVGAILEYIDIN